MTIEEIKEAISKLDITDVEIMDAIMDEIPNAIIAGYFNRYLKSIED